jgi:hypothetical protein
MKKIHRKRFLMAVVVIVAAVVEMGAAHKFGGLA